MYVMKCFKEFVAIQLMRLPLKVTAYGNLDLENYCYIRKTNFYKALKWAILCSPDTISLATFSTQCTHLANRLSSITTATTGQTTIGSETQLDLLMMGIKMPETLISCFHRAFLSQSLLFAD